MNCTSCNMPHAGHELVDGKCVRCLAAELKQAKAKEAEYVACVEQIRLSYRDAQAAVEKENSDLRQRLAVFETPEYHRLKAACVEYEDSETKCNLAGPIVWTSLQLRRFKAKASLEETAIAFARAQK